MLYPAVWGREMLLLHFLCISRGVSSSTLPYLGRSWEPRSGSFQTQGGGLDKNNNPSAPAQKENCANSGGCCWGRQKAVLCIKAGALRRMLTTALLPCTSHPLHQDFHSQPPSGDNDVALCPTNRQTHNSSCWLCP